MRRVLLLGLFPGMLAAAGWVKFTSGPFEVLTDAGARPGRETLVRFEQLRHALGQVVGEQDLASPRPVRILLFKNPKGWEPPGALADGRDSYAIVPQQDGAVPPDVFRALTRLFLDTNTARMPAPFERGLIEFFSTISISGIRITAGAPPAKPDLDWARVHLLITDPEYYGKLRVLLYNLRRGVAEDASYKNAFGATPAVIEERAKAHLAAGNFQTISLSSKPMSERDFPERPVSDADARLARADLLGPQSSAEYEALLRDGVKVAESQEGLGLLALRSGLKDEARRRFSAAIDAGSSSARCYIEYARLEPDNEKASKALLRAAAINPKLDEPFAELARRDTDAAQRLAHWKAAAERNPRNASYWQALAEGYLAAHNFGDAAKAWSAGEQAAVDPGERRRMREARLAIEGQRLDYEVSEQKRKDDAEARELEKLKTEARAEVHALERKYNDGAPKTTPNAVPWWGGATPGGKITGTLRQVDCLGTQARLVVVGENRKTVRLLVSEPGKVFIEGTGEIALTCGSQKPRRVAIEYFPKANARLGTAGEVAAIHFQ